MAILQMGILLNALKSKYKCLPELFSNVWTLLQLDLSLGYRQHQTTLLCVVLHASYRKKLSCQPQRCTVNENKLYLLFQCFNLYVI